MERIARTVRRTPEVMVKVTGGGKSFGAVRAHLQYIGRDGDRPIETDDGQRVDSTASANTLLEDWDLDLVSGSIGAYLTVARRNSSTTSCWACPRPRQPTKC